MSAIENHDQSFSREFASLIAVLAGMFEDILKQPCVQPDDDFFELGGDSLAATELVLALEKIGIYLSMSDFFDGPTVVKLASVANGAGKRAEPPMVVLKAGTTSQPVFIAPGVGGSVVGMIPFARKVETSRQIYGLQPRDQNGNELALATIEEAAQFYLPLIRSVQPHGPYILAGYSMGGLTALELAQMLVAAGEEVALLVMLDTLTPLQHFPLHGKLCFWARRALHHSKKLRHLPLQRLLPYLTMRVNGIAKDLGVIPVPERRRLSTPTVKSVKATGAAAFLNYRPHVYPGSITFIQAEMIDEWVPYYPDLLWGYFAQNLVLHRVGGDHWNMLNQHAEEIANTFSQCLDTVGFSAN